MFKPASPSDAVKTALSAGPGAGRLAYCFPQEGLKAAVWYAPAGTGEVQRIISEAPFKPGVRGFTSLLQLCSRDRTSKAWQKVSR